MTPYATLMCHEMATWRNDKLTNLDLEVKRMTKIQAQLDKLVTDNTKITQEMLDKSKGTDLYFDYDMALEYGIVKEELSEEEQLAKALEDMDKEDMTQAEFDAFVEEMKELVNIVPDNEEEVEGESLDDEEEQEVTTDDKEKVECECVEPADCEKYKGSHKCCNFCEDKSDCKFNICAYAFDKEECEYIKNN